MVQRCNKQGIRTIVELSITQNNYFAYRKDYERAEIQKGIRTVLKSLLNTGVAGFRLEPSKAALANHAREIFGDLRLVNPFPADSRPLLVLEGTSSSRPNPSQLGKTIFSGYADEMNEILSKNGDRKLKDLKKYLYKESLKVNGEDAAVFVDRTVLQKDNLLKRIHFREPKLLKIATAAMLALPYGSVFTTSLIYVVVTVNN